MAYTRAPHFMDRLAEAYLDAPAYVIHFEQGDRPGFGGWTGSDYENKILYIVVGQSVSWTLNTLLHETFHAEKHTTLRRPDDEDHDRRLVGELREELVGIGAVFTHEEVEARLAWEVAKDWHAEHEEVEARTRAWAKAAQDALVEIAEGEGRNPESLALEEWCKLGVQHTPLKEQLSGI